MIEQHDGNWTRCSLVGKICYQTKKAALQNGRSHNKGHGHAYRCPHCKFIHYTSQPKAVRRAIVYLLESMK